MVSLLRTFAIFLLVGWLSSCAQGVDKQTEAEALVDMSRWTIEGFKRRQDDIDQLFRANLKDAKGVVIFPNVVKGAFFVGASGGPGILIARNRDGSWGYPAFYTLGSASFGLQFGGQSAEIVMVLRSADAVKAVIEYQGKLGADMQMTVGNAGAGVSAATTSNVGADIVSFAHGQGVYAGISLQGAVIGRRNDLNDAYYGRGATPQTIVEQGKFQNAQADALRQALVVD